jgi:CPA2 family monovalent cation:H+ antiporter-2
VAGFFLIQDLAVVLVTAGAVAWLCQRLGLSAIVGYLVAGAVIGPNTPPFALVADQDRVQTLAQLGLVFLVFSIGLNLSISRLQRLGLSIIIATIIGAMLVLNGGRLCGLALGWSGTAGLFLAAMLMVSSSAIISKVLEELNQTHERAGQLALGMTVLEDVVAITMLTLLTSLIQFGGAQAPPVLPTLGALSAFIVFIALLSLLIVPKLLARLNRNALPEIRTLIVGGLLLLLAWLAVKVGYSLALGAFIFGAIIGSTRYKDDVELVFRGMDQIFGAVFFVAVGMLVDFRVMLDAWPLVLGVTALALVLRPIACSLGFIAVGNTGRESIQAGLIVVPLGEFSFIIAQLGVESGVLPKSMYAVAVGASLLTSLAAPLMARRSEAISERIVGATPAFVGKWIDFYHGWLQRLRGRQTASVLWKLTHKRFLQVGIHMLFVSAALLFATPIYQKIKGSLTNQEFATGVLPFLFWSVFGVLLLGPLIAIWRNISALAMIVSEAATQGARRQSGLRPLLEAALRVVALVVLVTWLLALLPPGWSLWGVAGVVLLVLVLVATIFWRRFVKLHSRLEIELEEQFKRASHKMATTAWSDALPQQTAGWDLDIDEVTLPSDSAHAGKTLLQLAVRQNFGCSVVGIDRQGFSIVNPPAQTVLYPQDKLLLLGHAEQLAHAARELSAGSTGPVPMTDFDELTMETLVVPPDSPVVGKSLLELDLIQRVGVQVGGIRRGRDRNLVPSGRDRIQAGDALLVLGSHLQIKGFIALLVPPAEGAGGGDTDLLDKP